MSWKLSRFRAGDMVVVRATEEILATLDERGCLDGMPFMPEMLKFCGRQFRVSAVAHKTCDTARQTWTGRRLQAAVHLTGLRCDGSSHGGCQAECSLFWKDAWLRLPNESGNSSVRAANDPHAAVIGCTEATLFAATQRPSASGDNGHWYSCQATNLYDFTDPLPWWNPLQYFFDVKTRNHSVGRVLRVLWLSWLRWLLPRLPMGYRLGQSFGDWMHTLLTGRPSPRLQAKVPRGTPTPTGRLNLLPGEYVRVKSQQEIEKTITASGHNRGLFFDHEEMAPYCGRIFRVHKTVTKIIDEPTGKMVHMKQPCIMLEGVVCNAEYANCRLNCPRAIPSYWRELWLERVGQPLNETSGSDCDHHQDAGTSDNLAKAPALMGKRTELAQVS